MIERKNCPDCGSSLGAGAYKCRCGWKASASESSQPMTRIECAHASCLQGAIARVRTKTGWANVCLRHYETQNQAQAVAYAEKHVLKTPYDHIAHMKALLAKPRDHRAWMNKPKSALAAKYANEVAKRIGEKEEFIADEAPELETSLNF